MNEFNQNDISYESYNDYLGVRKLPSVVMNYLFNNCEELWKLLYYSGDTIGKENVQNSIKKSMISTGSSSGDENYQVMFQFFTKDSTSKANSQLRIQVISAESTNKTNVLCRLGIQCIVENGNMIIATDEARLDNRALAMAQAIIKSLNGQKLENAKTPLNIDKSIDRYSGVVKYDFNSSFSGYNITMSCYV